MDYWPLVLLLTHTLTIHHSKRMDCIALRGLKVTFVAFYGVTTASS